KRVPSICQEELIAMQRCRRGSRKAFEVFVNKYMKDAYFIALGLVGNREDALELSQEAFVRAYRNIKRVKPDRKFFPWFYQILKNLCVSHLRKRKYRKASSLDVEGAPEVEAAADCFSPEAVARRNEIKDRVWQAIGRLDEKHREVIILRHFQNMSYDKIAEILCCNKGTVTSRLYYARKKLEELLGAEKGGMPNDMP
ncbi:MAG: sigma-70 family RNA polymerase sigma factor, partial [Sedimentisphaerales bacterium]|nr:sigma-70 family RNA polymerase sigma factor [Sedimentisphaerales bacterium]